MGLNHGLQIPAENMIFLWDAASLYNDNRQANANGDGLNSIGLNRRFKWTGTSTWNSGFKGYRIAGASSLSVEPAINFTTSTISFCLWNLGGIGQSGVAFALGNNNNISIDLPRFSAGAGSSILFRADNGDPQFISKVVSAEELHGWTFWAGTKNATTGNMRLYRNGELWHSGGSRTTTILTNAGETGYLFSARGGQQPLQSALSMFFLYNSELTQTQIQKIFNSTRGRYGV